MRATDPPPARHPRPQAWLLGMVSECWHAYVEVLARPDAAGGAPCVAAALARLECGGQREEAVAAVAAAVPQWTEELSRLIAVGDMSYSDYEAVVRVTLNEIEPYFESPSNRPALGLIARWAGHPPDGNQPSWHWDPIGAFAAIRFREIRE